MSVPEVEVAVDAVPVTGNREALRAHLLSSKPKAKSTVIDLFGVDVELRQPSFKSIMTARETEDPVERAASMIIKYAFVPGTNEQVFDDADMDQILDWPFGEDLARLNTAITELTGVNMDEEEEKLETHPLV